MKTILLTASLGLLGLASGGAAQSEGPITILVGQGVTVKTTIDPEGEMVIEGRLPGAEPAEVERRTVAAGPGGYARIRALVKPLRAYAGKTLACDPVPATPLSRGGAVPVTAVVRWEREGFEVKAPLTCMQGPAQDEIELIRAAMDDIRRWANEGPPEPFDGPANAVMENGD